MTTPGTAPPGIAAPALRLRRLGIDTHTEPVVYMRSDCHVCRAEGFSARERVEIRVGRRSAIATLNIVTGGLLAEGEAGLSEAAWTLLDAREGDRVEVAHPAPVESLGSVRAKLYGHRLDDEALRAIIGDVVAQRYSDIELAAFVAAGAADRLDLEEAVGLTRAMIEVGEHLAWRTRPVLDKHCVGGLPGNRTTPIVVAIAAACGLTIPKTSSRAITSPAGTADTMETLAPVDLDLAAMRRVVEREGGCIVWGGAVRLSPADDILIRIERPLDLDSEGQLVASVLSKKAAAGSTHVLIDLPVGPTAKVRSAGAAASLARLLVGVGEAVGLKVDCLVTDGTQPVGRGVGPALEAIDVLAVLHDVPDAPADLRERAVSLAGRLIEIAGHVPAGAGVARAREVLRSGAAWRKFAAICEAQGGLRSPTPGRFTHAVVAPRGGRVVAIDNRRLARVAKLAGAPREPGAGLRLHRRLGDPAEAGDPLFTLYAEAPGELAYALDYVARQTEIVNVA
ncbi:MAG: thymidine phosphorylase family protein [Burkholderiales bacterium]|jgi:thymidine phosphorylase|nr:thymidine phosphorylase family protein [Burkholderiales bacterium]